MCNPSSGVTLLLTVVRNARTSLRKGDIWISLVMENRLCFGMTKAVRLSSAVFRNVSGHMQPRHKVCLPSKVFQRIKSRGFYLCAFFFFCFTRKEIPYGIFQCCFNWFENDDHFLLWTHKHLDTKTQLLQTTRAANHVKVNIKCCSHAVLLS